MSLYTHKEENIRKTWILFTGFLVIVIGIGYGFSRIYGNTGILVIAVLFSISMSLISYWYSDKIVLAMSRAKPVTRENAEELYNIVENLAITSGLPTPKIYIIQEKSPNAFATGRNPEHAVVAVTEGLLERLDRSELEGVLAHEMSHIGNRDMLVSTMVVVLVGFIALISDWFTRSLLWGGMGGDDRNNRAAGIMILVGLVLAILSPIVATLIQLAISRKREFLADASGALLTRYPEGLAAALEKISRDPTPMMIQNHATAHLWFSSPEEKRPKRSRLTTLFMTHPPMEERIKRLREMSL